MPFGSYEASEREEERGYDTTVVVNGTDIPVTNVSYDIEANTEEIQFNDSMTPTIATTGMTYSGSFEHAGSNSDALNPARDSRGFPRVEENTTIIIREWERTVKFTGVIIQNRSKDMPSDGRTSETYDFVAEDVTIS